MMMYKGTQKWCNPFGEWKFFVSTLTNNCYNNEERGKLDQAMGIISSSCLKPLDYTKFERGEERRGSFINSLRI